MANYLVLGCGKFGRLALQRLTAQNREARFLVVDQNPKVLPGLQAFGPAVETAVAEVGEFLTARLTPKSPWDWLIPMVPVHVAYVWLRHTALASPDWEPAAVPDELENLAARAIRGPAGELYLSRARHVCPDDCEEPEVCPVDGESREPPLYQQLAEFSLRCGRLLVVASRQLAPGVGGYAPARLWELAEAAQQVPDLLLLATACRCHGVVHGLRRQRKAT